MADVPRYVAPTVQEEPLTGYKIRYWESDKDVSQANDTTVYIGSYDFKLEVVTWPLISQYKVLLTSTWSLCSFTDRLLVNITHY